MSESSQRKAWQEFLFYFSEFVSHLDSNCGVLTLHSSLKDLVKYTQAGLEYLAKEREIYKRATNRRI